MLVSELHPIARVLLDTLVISTITYGIYTAFMIYMKMAASKKNFR